MATDINKIYVIKNTFDNRVYVGQTWMKPNRRYSDHIADKHGKCIKLFNALNKYGRGNFYYEVLVESKAQKDADFLEKYFIEYFNSVKNGFNIKEGGSSSKLTEEIKKKISEKTKGENNPFFGKEHALESINKMSQSHLGMHAGEKNPSSKLSDIQRKEIFYKHSNRNIKKLASIKQLSIDYQLSIQQIYNILNKFKQQES